MTGASPSENPFILIRDTFDGAYEPGATADVAAVPGGQEFMSGRQPDGGELGLYRLGLAYAEEDAEVFRVQTAPMPDIQSLLDDDIGEEVDANVQEYLIGGSEHAPIGCEITCMNPLEARLLEPHEMAELAEKIGATTFRSSITPTQ